MSEEQQLVDGLLGRKKNTKEGECGGGSDRLHELTVRYKAAQAGAGSGEGPWASGLLICGAAGQGRRTQSLGGEGTRGLATLPPFPPRYALSEATSPRGHIKS